MIQVSIGVYFYLGQISGFPKRFLALTRPISIILSFHFLSPLFPPEREKNKREKYKERKIQKERKMYFVCHFCIDLPLSLSLSLYGSPRGLNNFRQTITKHTNIIPHKTPIRVQYFSSCHQNQTKIISNTLHMQYHSISQPYRTAALGILEKIT